MRIDLGLHTTHQGQTVHAWLEPNFPMYREGVVQDHGFLCVHEVFQCPSQRPAISLKLQGMDEQFDELCKLAGGALAAKLWHARDLYDSRPFFMTYNHKQLGQLYAEPYIAGGTVSGIAFFQQSALKSASSGLRFSSNAVNLPLAALFAQELLSAQCNPNVDDFSFAIEHGKIVASRISRACIYFTAVVDWGFENRLSDIMLSSRTDIPKQANIVQVKIPTLSN